MQKSTGVLMIHGLMGSPREYDSVEAVLRAEGYPTRTVTLPGHGANPAKRFYHVNSDEILQHCLEEYYRFTEECEEIVIMGHSLGGICTLLTAAEQPRGLRGVVVLSAPYEHAFIVNKMHKWLTVPLQVLIPGMQYLPDCRTGHERPEYKLWMFPRLLNEAETMFRYMRGRLHNIDVPVMLAHSKYDLSIPYEEMDKIIQAIGKPELITAHTLERCGHQIFPKSREKDRTIQLICQFLHQATGVDTLAEPA